MGQSLVSHVCSQRIRSHRYTIPFGKYVYISSQSDIFSPVRGARPTTSITKHSQKAWPVAPTAGCLLFCQPMIQTGHWRERACYISNKKTHESFLCMQLQSLFSRFCPLEGCVWESFPAQHLFVPAALWPLIRTEMAQAQCLSQVLNAYLKKEFLGRKKKNSGIRNRGFGQTAASSGT